MIRTKKRVSRLIGLTLRILLVDIRHIGTADTFPTAVVEKRDLVAIDTVYLVTIAIYRIPVLALLDQETAVPEHQRNFVGITVHFPAGTMVDIPIAGIALERYIAKREVIDSFAVDAAHQVAVFVRQIPSIATPYAVIAVVEQVDLIAIQDGTASTVDIDGAAGSLHIAPVPEILVIVGTPDSFARGDFITRILEPQVILIGHDVLRRHRHHRHQSYYERTEPFHTPSLTNSVPEGL